MEAFINNHPFLSTLSDEVKRLLFRFGTNSARFTQWFLINETKIVSKFRGSRGVEDIHDVLTELRCASFLLSFNKIIELQYEPLHQTQQSPDFKAITSIEGDIYFEVRRIRKTPAESNRDQFIELFWEKVKTNIHRNFGLSLDTSSIERTEHFQELIQKIDEIIAYIDSYLSKLIEDMKEPVELELSLGNFDEVLGVLISSIPEQRRVNNEIRNYGGLFKTPYSGNEYKKFGDIIFEKTHQLIDGEKNVIFVYADNDTHESYEMMDSIASINDLIREADEKIIRKKGYESINDFLAKSRRISGIFLLTKSQERKFWINRGSEHPINDDFKSIFESSL